LLKNLLDIYIPASKKLDFLVGYFYFSGFLNIYRVSYEYFKNRTSIVMQKELISLPWEQIDKMVYELYGLSEAEIKIVEGKK
jgi:hypothetical protein